MAGRELNEEEKATLKLFIEEVRIYLRDYAELNRLLQGQQNSNVQIAYAAIDSLDDWNNTPPQIAKATITTHPSKSLWLRGTVISLLESNMLLGIRNHLQYSDGGTSIDTEKFGAYMQALNVYKQSYEQAKLRLKTQINTESAYGHGINSEYLWIGSLDFLR